MKIRELLKESSGKVIRGMLVQTPEEFIKNPFGENPLDEDEDEKEQTNSKEKQPEYQPMSFIRTIPSKASYSAEIEPEKARKDSYSKLITPDELVQIVHHKNSYVVYHEQKSPDDPHKKIKKRITTDPIYPSQEIVNKAKKSAANEINMKFPDASEKIKKQKAYIIANKKIEDFVLYDAIQNNSEVIDAIKKGVDANKLKVDQFIKTSTKVSKPAVHKSSVPIVKEVDGEYILYDLDELAESITKRPDEIIKENAKMKKSSGGDILMANLGIPAINGLVLDEKSKNFMVVNTCPGAGVCKNYCYATRGGYIQYSASFESQARILNFWYNDPEGFKQQVLSEVKSFISPGVDVYIRWHDSGDFFDDAYMNMAFDIAKKIPSVTFYAYTKIAKVVNDPNIPKNFIINFSEGAKPHETKQVDLTKTKFSQVVPKELFKDESTGVGLKRLQEKNPIAQQKMKEILAKTYKLDIDTILTYDEMMNTPQGNIMKYNVMVVPSLDGDLSAARRDVHGSYLLYH